MSLIIFTCATPAATWEPTVNPMRGGRVESKEIFQPKDFCGSDLYSYSHGDRDGMTLEWGYMPAADMQTLLAFLTAMGGGRNTFTLTDYDSATYAGCRVLNCEAFPVQYALKDEFFKCTIELEVPQ